MANRAPNYCRYGNYARVKINGKWQHLGAYDSEESHAKYKRLVIQWATDQPETRAPDNPLTVAQVLEAYRTWAERYYGDTPRGRYRNLLPIIRSVRELFADTPADQFSPKKLKLVRESYVGAGCTRDVANRYTRQVVAIFRWAAEEELVPGSLPHALKAVRGLRRGHSDAPEGRRVLPVPQSAIDATQAHLCDVLADMVTVQVLTGMRSGELVTMTPGQLDRSGDVWTYRPDHHKTEHHGHDRVIAVGPKAQAILTRYLLRPADAPCFSPREALTQSLDTRSEQRRTPLSCGNRPDGRKRKRAIERVGDRYDVASYRRAIHRACDRAFPAPRDLTAKEKREWHTAHRWSPHQLRHSAGTNVREQFGLDASQAVLGHRHARVTEVYSELNIAKAAEVARVMG